MYIAFHVDELSALFAVLTTVMWIFVGIYALDYTKHDEHRGRFFFFYILVYFVLLGLDFSANAITMYMFYEFMTLTSMPLILHEQTPEAVKAAFKYLYYSIAGALLSLFGIFVFAQFAPTLDFVAGGVLDASVLEGHETLFTAAVICMLIGFGAKAGMFPMHAWLPEAHPVAPAPASAVFSGIIAKSGVLAIVRCVFYLSGADFLRGTTIQTIWMTLALITVLMGSMRAYQEDVLKKRLAYSTVSQISYVLFGLSTLHPAGFAGAMLHVIYHSTAKNLLFMGAGSVIHQTGKTKVSELRGIGKMMPVAIGCFTFAGLSLIGIPPFSGFFSKWYLAEGSFKAGIPGFSWAGPVILLVSALLTAGYLLPVSIDGFLPGKHTEDNVFKKCEAGLKMTGPMVILALAVLLMGIYSKPLIHFVETMAASVL